jgi:hypothetical protein
MGKIATTGYHNGCKITGADVVPPKSAEKSPQVAVGFENAAGDYITWYGSLSPAALPYTVERLRNAGWTGNDLSTVGSLVGKVADIKVVEDSYNGQTSLKVSGIYAQRPPKKRDPTDPATVKSIAAQFASQIAAIDAKKAAQESAQEEPPPTDADMLPF